VGEGDAVGVGDGVGEGDAVGVGVGLGDGDEDDVGAPFVAHPPKGSRQPAANTTTPKTPPCTTRLRQAGFCGAAVATFKSTDSCSRWRSAPQRGPVGARRAWPSPIHHDTSGAIVGAARCRSGSLCGYRRGGRICMKKERPGGFLPTEPFVSRIASSSAARLIAADYSARNRRIGLSNCVWVPWIVRSGLSVPLRLAMLSYE
jgi:hypothetical protein